MTIISGFTNKRVALCVLQFLLLFLPAFCFGDIPEPHAVRFQKSDKKLTARLFEDIRQNHAVLEDGAIIPIRRLARGGAAEGGADGNVWRWVPNEPDLKRLGLTYIATVIVEVTGTGEYAIQHLMMSSYAETAIPNYILVIPWDAEKSAGAWVEGLAKPCGMRDYPLGRGVVKPMKAFEMVRTRAFAPDLFIESLKNGATYQSLLVADTRCTECRGTGRVRPKIWIGRQKNDTVPCMGCSGSGKVKKNMPYIVQW